MSRVYQWFPPLNSFHLVHFSSEALLKAPISNELLILLGLDFDALDLALWQYGLWSFQTGGKKLERFLPKNQHSQRKLLNFVRQKSF